jgi:hypothetical protein
MLKHRSCVQLQVVRLRRKSLFWLGWLFLETYSGAVKLQSVGKGFTQEYNFML